MREDTVVQLRQPGAISEDPLTEVLRLGARRLLAQAVEMEVTAFVEGHADLTDVAGRRRIVRHGYLPARAIQTGIGPVGAVGGGVHCPSSEYSGQLSLFQQRPDLLLVGMFSKLYHHEVFHLFH